MTNWELPKVPSVFNWEKGGQPDSLAFTKHSANIRYKLKATPWQDSSKMKSGLNSISSPSQTKNSPSKGSVQLVKQYGVKRTLLFAGHPKFIKFCMESMAVLWSHTEHILGLRWREWDCTCCHIPPNPSAVLCGQTQARTAIVGQKVSQSYGCLFR